jgi:hypothetical protein
MGVFDSQSQNFINPGAQWNFKTIVSGAPYTAFTNWKYQNDTLIQGLTYHVIKEKTKNFNYFSSSIFEYSSGSFLLRSSGDSLFYSNGDSLDEHLLYDFTPVVGNMWDVSPFFQDLDSAPTTPQYVQTSAFGDTVINGISVNWIEIISLNQDSLYFGNRIYNHMGNRLFFPYWSDGLIDSQGSFWNCYKDDIIGEVSYSVCNDYSTLGIENTNPIIVNLIPDALSNRLIINENSSKDLTSIAIYDMMGRKVFFSEYFGSNQIELFLDSGIYICKMSIGESYYCSKFKW